MASKSAVQTEAEKAEVIEEALNDLEKEIDRLKSMYEQYFLGIQKTAPAFIHNEVDRKIRELTQANIRQTRLRYKFVTLNQKFGSYNAYWRRTLREIESGKYIRNLQKIGREAVRSGDEIPQEILNAMPKRMREQVVRDREAAIAQAKRRGKLPANEFTGEDSTQEDAELGLEPPDGDDFAAVIKEPTELRRSLKQAPNRPHQLTKEDADFDLDAFFKQVETDEEHTNVKGGAPVPAPSTTRISPAPPPARVTQPLGSAKPPADPARPPPTPPARPSEPVVQPARVTSAQPPVRPSDPVLAPPPPAPPGVARIRPSVAMAAVKPPPTPPATPPPSPTTPVIPRNNQTQPGFQPAKAGLQTMPGVQPAKPASARQPLVQPPPPVTTQPVPAPVQTAPLPRMPGVPGIARIAASQATKPLTVQPGAADSRPTPVVESVSSGQFKRPPAAPALRPPPGMSDADVNALHANYIKAKQMVGEDPGSGSRDKLLRTINAQAPKIMDQYKVGAVDFSVIVKDNQVIIRAKPKGKP